MTLINLIYICKVTDCVSQIQSINMIPNIHVNIYSFFKYIAKK
jgi:hypothetical protein